MRRALTVVLALAACALAGCATWNDRYGYVRSDPVIWFLGGAPTEMQLDWPRREVPTLRPLIKAARPRSRSCWTTCSRLPTSPGSTFDPRWRGGCSTPR